MSSYADDTLLYIRNPEVNLSPVLREVCFGELSGLKINWNKSIIFLLRSSTIPIVLDFPLTWTTEPVRYLGIQIHADPETVFRENCGRAVTKLEDDIERWIRLPISLLGRISLMKMVILRRFLFLNIPMVLPAHFFKTITSILIRLAWAGKQPRVRWKVLTLPYYLGGQGAPDLDLYYRVAQSSHAFHWLHQTLDLPHLHIEKVAVAPSDLPSSLFRPPDRRTGILDSINSTVHAWWDLVKRQDCDILIDS